MLTILKTLFRICLIAAGLLAIGSGGLCVMIGSNVNDGLWIVLLGLLAVAGGGLTVWWVFHNWRRADANNPSSNEEPTP